MTDSESTGDGGSDRLSELDLLALSIKAALERAALPLAKTARALCEARVWSTFGYARVEDYARERLGRTGRWLRDQASLGRSLDSLPALADALCGADGGRPLGKVSALSVGKVASLESVGAWVELARVVSVRELKESVKRALHADTDLPPCVYESCAQRDGVPQEEAPQGSASGEYGNHDDCGDRGNHSDHGEHGNHSEHGNHGEHGNHEDCGDRGNHGEHEDRGDHSDDGEHGNHGDCGDRGNNGKHGNDSDYGDRGNHGEHGRLGGCDSLDQRHGDDLDEYHRLGIAMPVAVRAAFEETLCLYRCVSGREASVTSFIEALVAEAHAGARPPGDVPDVKNASFLRRRGVEAAVERELAERTALWSVLRDRCASGSESALASDALARFVDLSRRAGRGDHAELDRQMLALIEIEDELERRLGRLLRELNDRRAWRRLCFAGLRHYAEQRLGLGRTAVEGRVRLARTLRRYPDLRRSYERGRLGLESALLVVRILGASRSGARSGARCDPATEQAWVRRAEQATVKRLRDELRALRREEAYAEGSVPALPLDDATWHGSLLQRPGDVRARVHELGSRAVASGCSDVFLRLTLPEETARDFLATVESSRKNLSALQAANPPREPSSEPWGEPGDLSGEDSGEECEAEAASLRAARTFFARGRAVPSWVGLLALLEDFVDTWDLPEESPRRRSDDVYSREGWRCFAPGCTSRRNLEDHHLRYRSRGGDAKALSNRICLCAFHHRRGEHGGLARCRGRAPLGVLWRLGRNDVGVWFRNERRLNADRATREAEQWNVA